uniref:Uncharacterized protein n=1 Tax=Anguilla anguilla TaxID=7936 RepID=A0A0E9XRA9_ANGAN
MSGSYLIHTIDSRSQVSESCLGGPKCLMVFHVGRH